MYLSRKLFAGMLTTLLWISAQGQTTIWSEDFTYVDGTTAGPAGKWTSGCATCLAGDYFEVRNGMMEGVDVNDFVTWESESIDINGFNNVRFSMDVFELGDHEGPGCACGINVDYFDVYYSVDGGPFTVIENWNNDGEPGHTLTGDTQNGVFDDADFGSTNVFMAGISGNSLVLRVMLRNTAGSEFLQFDNVLVTGEPLPVEFLSLRATDLDDHVLVEWETIQEDGNAFFALERSADGVAYEELTQVPGAGYSETLRSYAYTDLAPLAGNAFYRLRQVDFDGAADYSPVVMVHREATGLALHGLWPNPAADMARLRFSSDAAQPALIRILDLRGALMWQTTADVQPGLNEQVLDLQALPAGLYIVQLQAGSQRLNQRLVVRQN